MDGKDDTYWFAPVVADAGAGFGGTLNVFELVKAMIEAGAACVHFEDQLSSAKKRAPRRDKSRYRRRRRSRNWQRLVLRWTSSACPRSSWRAPTPTAHLLTTDIDPRDREFLTGERTAEGFFCIKGGLQAAIARALSYAPYADLIWYETSHPDLEEARLFAEAAHAKYPGKFLATTAHPRSIGERIWTRPRSRGSSWSWPQWATNSSS
jgi:isocitrate lyase